MQKYRIEKSFILFLIALFAGLAVVQSVSGTGLTVPVNTDRASENLVISVASQDAKTTRLDYQIDDFDWSEVVIEGKEYWHLFLGNESNIAEKGMPGLPVICRSIVIPDDARMEARVTFADFELYENILVAPSKGTLLRTVNPADVPYEFGYVYQQDAWYPEKIAELDEPYIVRDLRGQVVKVNPFQYNSARRELRVYTDITIEVSPAGPGEINVFDRREPLTTIDPEFMRIYEKHFLNFGPGMTDYTAVEEQGNMLVITYDDFWVPMKAFVGWKNMKGIPTELVRISDIGNDENSIKDYIADYYNNRGLTYVLLVGDIEQITTFRLNFGFENGASDPEFSYLAGNDHYPDLFVGRFSAQNLSQVTTMVRRSIEYERYPQEGADWYHHGVGLGSNEGVGDDGEYDWEHIRNIRSGLMGYTYSLVEELYDGSHGGEDATGNPSSSMVSDAVDAGRTVINYCGHGWDTGWVTSDFDNNDVNGLVNDNMLPFIWSVACVNGAFDDNQTCFAEAWLRATHNGEPSGAVAAFMSSINQSWSPPMEGQDEMNAILCESYRDNIKRTFGGISFNGCMSMNDKYGTGGYEMTDTWHVFGDPSLEVRTDTPSSITVEHEAMISIGSNGFEVVVPGVEGALCSISRDSVYLGSGYTNGSGRAIIHLDEPLSDGSDVDLVVTAYNSIPYQSSIGVSTEGSVLYVDDSYQQFVMFGGDWLFRSHPSASNNDGWFTRAGSGTGSLGWGVTSLVEPGTYDVYIWKFEHSMMHLMATDAHYKVYHSTGESDWILIDQSTAGDEWLYLGSYDFDRNSTQGVLLTDEANGIVIADMIKLVQTGKGKGGHPYHIDIF